MSSLGLVGNTKSTPSAEILSERISKKADVYIEYAEQHRFDGYTQIVDRAHRRKAGLNKQVMTHVPQEVIFIAGDLVQVPKRFKLYV
jgi:hypothetical protein